ncbi:MAG: helix-turn-helix domain-containing protein [Rhizobium sp.]|nr:helix-turn-helix domain-containing protein [Rhizobium sp.]
MQTASAPIPGSFHWSERPFLHVREVAELLSISRATVYVLAKNGPLRIVSIGQRRLIDTSTLVRYIDALKAEAAERAAQAVPA